MASKRQRKKNQTKKNITMLQSVGYKDKKVIKQIRNKPQLVNKIVKKESDYVRWRHQSDILEMLGFKRSAAQRTWGEKRFNKWYEEQKTELKKKKEKEERSRKIKDRKSKNDTDLYLLMFWKEKTNGFADEGIIDDFKHEYRHLPNEYLIDSINGFLTTKDPLPALIGTTHISVIQGSQRKAYIQFMKHFDEGKLSDMTDWMLVYEGKASMNRYHELLLGIHTIIRLLYDASEKADFIGNLITKYLPQVNKKTARRLAKDLNFRGF
jgi:hypothetical protein